MPVFRRQATLFLHGNDRVTSVRCRFNPIQAGLIGPHVTLIREDEVEDRDALAARVVRLRPSKVSMNFSEPMRDGNFVWCHGTSDAFDGLRAQLLGSPRKHSPHLTLIHPRNGVCDDAAFREITSEITRFKHVFQAIAFIEQSDGGPWKIISEFPLQ